MPPFHQQIEIGPTDGARSQRIIVHVNPASLYSVIPAAVLTMLEIELRWAQKFQLADGGVGERQMAEIKIRLEGQERTTVCVFGDAETEPVRGKHSLDTFGLTLDEGDERLVPARFNLW